jgi:hypothetical protein
MVKDHLTLVKKTLPATVDEAVVWIVGQLSAESRTALASRSKEKLGEIRFSFGMWVESSLGLLGGNRELLEACGKQHPDDASAVIVRAVWEKVKRG